MYEPCLSCRLTAYHEHKTQQPKDAEVKRTLKINRQGEDVEKIGNVARIMTDDSPHKS